MTARDSTPGPAVPMTLCDHAWLRMDEPQNLVVIHTTLIFETALTLADAALWLKQLFTPHHQFTHRIERSWLGARFVPDPAFSPTRHLQEAQLPPGSGVRELQALTTAHTAAPLPTDRALWQATLVQGVDGASALLLRIHHCLIDGRALMALLARKTALADGAAPQVPARVSVREDLSLGNLLRRAPRMLADAAHILFMRRDRATRLKGRPGLEKAMAWSAPLPLQQVRELAHRCQATVNDAMLAVISDALRGYLGAKGERPRALLRAVVPMDLRPRGEEHLLGNRFGLVGVDLPVHEADAQRRIERLRDQMTGLKLGTQSQLGLALLRLAGTLPRAVQQAIFGLFTGRCTAVITNVIGPAEARSVAGHRLRDLLVFVPQSITIGVGISIMSYADTVRVGFLADRGLMPDPELAASMVAACFERLNLALQSPAAGAAGASALPGAAALAQPQT